MNLIFKEDACNCWFVLCRLYTHSLEQQVLNLLLQVEVDVARGDL